jgi:hypothetical protein
MSLSGVLPLMRHAKSLMLPAAFALSMTAGSAAVAQTQPSDNFASSTQGFVADDVTSAGLPIAPAASGISGAAGQSGDYGYHDHSWTSKLAFEGGAGFNAPIGNDNPYITWGGNFTVGGGLHFTKRLAGLVEFQFIDDKLPGAFVAAGGGENGSAHIWSFTVDPVFDLFPKRTNSVYVTGGGGFYRKVTSFTDLECCDFFGYPVSVVANHFSSNQGGVNFGVGLTHRLGGVYGDGQAKLFAEARYLYLDTPAIGETNGLGTTELIPVTLGVRF